MPHLPPPTIELEEAKSGCAGRCRGFWRRLLNFEIWHNKRYVIWALAIPSALFGYFVPYVHLVCSLPFQLWIVFWLSDNFSSSTAQYNTLHYIHTCIGYWICCKWHSNSSFQVKYVRDVLGKDADSQLLVVCIGATSGIGRVIFGLIADRPWVNRIVLQQVCFIPGFCVYSTYTDCWC